MSGWTYGDDEQSPTATANFGEVEFRYFSGEQEISKPSNAGSYFVEAYVEDDYNGNYLGCVSTTKLSFTISKCQPAVKFPTYNILYLSNNETAESYATAPTATVKGESIVNTIGEFVFSDIVYKDGENQSIIHCSFVPYENYQINYEGASTTINVTVKTVAQINATNPVYYPTIELALAEAKENDVVYVLPDTTEKVKITDEKVTVPVNVSLIFLYGEVDSYSILNDSSYGTTNLNGAMPLATIPNSVVIVEEGVEIINNGLIDVAGTLSGGQGAYPYVGHTIDGYAELQLKNNAKITSYGNIRVTGYINDASTDENQASQVVVDSGSIGLPFILRDFKGGSYMNATTGTPKRVVFGQILSRTSQECAPFNQFEFRNLSVLLTVKYEGTLYGYINIYAGGKVTSTRQKFISKSGAVLTFNSSSSYVQAKYDPKTEICDLDIYGGIDLGALSFKVQFIIEKTVSTDDVYFPLSWRFNVSLNKAEGQTTAAYNLNKKLKLLPGAKLTIGEKVEATFANVTAYYNSYEDECEYHAELNYGHNLSLESAEIIVEGSMICNSFGGNITSKTTNASVQIKNSCSMTTKETTGKLTGEQLTAQINFHDVDTNATLSGDVKSSTGTYYYNATTQSWSTTKVAL